MSLSTTTDFNEAGTSSADFAAQKIVQANSTVQSGDVNTLVEKALRRTTHLDNIKVDIAGDTMTGALLLNAGATVASGQELTMDGAAIVGNVAFNVLGSVWLAGRKRGRARVTLSDADQTVDVSDGDRFTLPANNASARTITLDNTTIVPEAGETLTFFWNPGTAGGGGLQYTFERDDSTVIATFVGAQVADTGAVFAEFEYALISTGPDVYGWKLGKHSGTPNEYVLVTESPRDESWTSYGVVPGAGA